MKVIEFNDVSKRYKLYSKGGLYLRDRISHALGRLNPFNGHVTVEPELSTVAKSKLTLGTQHLLERDFWALKDVSFEVGQGESVGFIGRNGAGKSTILKLLAGVTKASSGQVKITGRVAALIEVGAGFHPELTGRENVFLNASILGMKKTEIEKQFDSIVSFAELEDFIDTPVKHYSSGMYVRLGFAIAAHTEPDIFLIDEVLAVGDASFQKKCTDTLAAHKAAGKTMILVSHDLEKIAEVCDRCIYLRNGQIEVDGKVEEAIAKYRRSSEAFAATRRVRSAPGQPAVLAKAGLEAVRIYNTAGQEDPIFQSGDDVVIKICFATTERIPNPAFSVAIHNRRNELVTCIDTRKARLRAEPIEGEGSVVCRLIGLPLQNGVYEVSVWLHDFDTKEIYDHRAYCASFKMTCAKEHDLGVLNVDREWGGETRFVDVSGLGVDQQPINLSSKAGLRGDA
jgi:ABC-type polysaccharide/polyol phosphate transport system ATPase subunit